jgi:DNA-directed RNA polymerase specialized sigma24 family protein
MPEAAEILTEALGRPIAFAQTPIEQVRQYSKDMAVMLQWFERVGYSADITGLEREFGRALTKLRTAHAATRDQMGAKKLRRAHMKAVRLLKYGHLHPAIDIACVLQVMLPTCCSWAYRASRKLSRN